MFVCLYLNRLCVFVLCVCVFVRESGWLASLLDSWLGACVLACFLASFAVVPCLLASFVCFVSLLPCFVCFVCLLASFCLTLPCCRVSLPRCFFDLFLFVYLHVRYYCIHLIACSRGRMNQEKARNPIQKRRFRFLRAQNQGYQTRELIFSLSL